MSPKTSVDDSHFSITMLPKLEITLGQHSQTGVKSNNEDFHGYTQPEEPQLSYKGIAIAIGDGMSGADGGRGDPGNCCGLFGRLFSTAESWTVKHSAQKGFSAVGFLFSDSLLVYK